MRNRLVLIGSLGAEVGIGKFQVAIYPAYHGHATILEEHRGTASMQLCGLAWWASSSELLDRPYRGFADLISWLRRGDVACLYSTTSSGRGPFSSRMA